MHLISGNIVTGYLLHVCQCARDDQPQRLEALNLNEEQITELSSVTLSELLGLAALLSNQTQASPDTILQRLRMLRLEDKKRGVMQALIRADTPRSDMYRLFGLSYREYTKLRQRYGMGRRGAPCVPSDTEIEAIDFALKGLGKTANERQTFCAQDYLFLHQRTGLSVRSLIQGMKRLADPTPLPSDREDNRSPKGRSLA